MWVVASNASERGSTATAPREAAWPAAASLGSSTTGGAVGSSPHHACMPLAGNGSRSLNVVVFRQFVPVGARKAKNGGGPNSAVS